MLYRPTVSQFRKETDTLQSNASFLADAAVPKGLQRYLNLISQRAKIQGFIVYVEEAVWPLSLLNQFLSRFDYASEYASARKELAKGLSSGAIKRKFHVVEGGIEQAPISLPMLFSGGNTGKLYVYHLSHLVNKLMVFLGW